MGLPEILETMLSTISHSNTVRTWSIYPEKDGSVSVKIRFDTRREPVNHDSSAHCKRKPNSQVQRDRQRSNAWRAKQTEQRGNHLGESRPLLDSGGDSESHVGMMTRSKSVVSEPEIRRSDQCSASYLLACPH